MAARGVRFGAITHSAGISSTGDAALDELLPFDERYCIPQSTAALIGDARLRGRRVIAIGTSVVRAKVARVQFPIDSYEPFIADDGAQELIMARPRFVHAREDGVDCAQAA